MNNLIDTSSYSGMPKEVLEMGRMHLEGNIIPHSWYEKIKFENGKVDLVSIILLSEIIYWYRPTYVRDEVSGKVIATHKKFKADSLQKSKQALADQFGLTERQVKDSLLRLEQLGLITRDYRTINTATGMRIPNVLFIKIHPKKIEEISFIERQPCDVETSYPRRSNVIPPTLKRHTYTENTTKNTKEEREEAAPPAISISFSADGMGLHLNDKGDKKYLKTGGLGTKKEHKVKYQTTTCVTNSNNQEQNSNDLNNTEEVSLKNKSKNNAKRGGDKAKRGVGSDKHVHKKEYREYVKLTVEQHEDLLKKYGQPKLDWMLNYLDAKKGSLGKEYKSDYHVLVESNWVNQEYEKQKREGKNLKTISVEDQNKNKQICDRIESNLREKGLLKPEILFQASFDGAFLIHKLKEISKKYLYNTHEPDEFKKILESDLRQVFPNLKIA